MIQVEVAIILLQAYVSSTIEAAAVFWPMQKKRTCQSAANWYASFRGIGD
jgi:hypothetical protein